MTNKQERYFVVSESELRDLIVANSRWSGYDSSFHHDGPERYENSEKAEAACRARPIPEYAFSFYCREYSKEAPQYIIRQWFEEIKK